MWISNSNNVNNDIISKTITTMITKNDDKQNNSYNEAMITTIIKMVFHWSPRGNYLHWDFSLFLIETAPKV